MVGERGFPSARHVDPRAEAVPRGFARADRTRWLRRRRAPPAHPGHQGRGGWLERPEGRQTSSLLLVAWRFARDHRQRGETPHWRPRIGLTGCACSSFSVHLSTRRRRQEPQRRRRFTQSWGAILRTCWRSKLHVADHTQERRQFTDYVAFDGFAACSMLKESSSTCSHGHAGLIIDESDTLKQRSPHSSLVAKQREQRCHSRT